METEKDPDGDELFCILTVVVDTCPHDNVVYTHTHTHTHTHTE